MDALAFPSADSVVLVWLREEPDAAGAPVPFRTPFTCSCAVDLVLRREGLVPHDGSEVARERAEARSEELCEALAVDSPGSTMCEDCVDSWEIDHIVGFLPF